MRPTKTRWLANAPLTNPFVQTYSQSNESQQAANQLLSAEIVSATFKRQRPVTAMSIARHEPMHRLSNILIAAVALLTGCSRPGIKGDGVIETENRPIADFSALEVTGAYQIKWSSGKPALSISTDQNLLPLIKTSVTGNTLQIEPEQTLAPTKGITINLSSASLADVRLTGAISFTASKLSGHELKLESNGASSISVDGSVTNLEATMSGASKLDAKSLQTQTATVSLNGASYADVTVTDTLNASISGTGLLTYSGNPKSVEKNVSGVGRIRPRP